MLTECPDLVEWLSGREDKLNLVEIGVNLAKNARALLQTFSIQRYCLIDPYVPYEGACKRASRMKSVSQANHALMIAQKKLARWSDIIEFHRMTSEEARDHIQDGIFDLVYVDGLHTEDAVWSDLCWYYGKLKSDGIIVGDDYCDADYPRRSGQRSFPGIAKAAKRFEKETGAKLHIACPKVSTQTVKFWFKREDISESFSQRLAYDKLVNERRLLNDD